APPALAQKLDEQPRTAIMTAFPPEHAALVGRIEQPRTVRVNGVPVTLGQMAGKPVLLVESGVSMVNAAMTTQWLVDRFAVKRILFSGIAGGIDPSLHIGDVVVAADWGQFMESTIAREAPGGKCLPHQPSLHVGGRGISGPAFMDNAAYRQYLFATFQAQVLDMESAAVAQVAYANRVPFLAFRSLSDLAGGDAEQNQMSVFMALASANSARVVQDFVARLPD
ncbi:phosphorylase, partial [Sphingobium sp. IP1]|uniref:5'-methylthioadenosine/S-adenosylhomocysteine nucleosidase n=1 Tax=Sphingobium sp. IP1 TaxID=2021637 RepID=UPI000C06F452